MLSFTRKRLVVVVVVFFCAVFALAAFSPVSRAWRVAGPGAESAAANEVNGPDKGDSRQASKDNPLVPDDFDCSTITEKGIDRQENLRAGAILAYCGWFPGAQVPGGESEDIEKRSQDPWHLLTPFSYGGLDVNVHPSNSAAIQSETFIYGDGGNNLMTTYNDLGSGSTGKGSRSTDGGATWAASPATPSAQGTAPTSATLPSSTMLCTAGG